MRVRKATLEDIPRIVELTGHFIGSTAYGQVLGFKPKKVAALAAQVLEHGVIFLAEVDGQIVGMLAGLAIVELIAGQRMLDEMVWWVEPAHRRGRVGPYLLRALELWARQKGLAMVKMVAPAGSGVGKFYSRMGYAEVETSWFKRL